MLTVVEHESHDCGTQEQDRGKPNDRAQIELLSFVDRSLRVGH
jgi:hypothetical protein